MAKKKYISKKKVMVDNAAKPTRYLKLKITNILNIIR